VVVFGVGAFGVTQLFADSFEEIQSSSSGFLLEEVLPANTWFWLSVSTLDPEQQQAYQAIVSRFSDDPDALRDKLLAGIDENLQSVDLSYIEDISPILGEEGVRFGFGLSEDGDGKVVVNVALTLQDPSKAQDLLNALEREGRFVKKTRDDFALYYNVFSEQESKDNPDVVVYNFAIYEDLFLIASSEDDLMDMLNRARSEGDESLWTDSTYQAAIEELPPHHLALFYVDSQEVLARQQEVAESTLTSSAASAGSAALSPSTDQYLKAQAFTVVALDNMLSIQGFGLGDRGKLTADDTTLDRLDAKKRYLYKDIPAQSIMAYFESYNLALNLSDRLNATEGTDLQGKLSTYLEAFVGEIPAEDLQRFLSEGYALSAHRNTGFLPGVSFVVDVSDGSLTAQTLLDAIDTQITSLVGLFKFQGGDLAEALSKDVEETAVGTFDVVRLDVDGAMSLYQSYGDSFVLPSALKGLQIVLLYGITDDDRLVVSNYEGWLSALDVALSDDADFQEATDPLDDHKEGVFFVDFDELGRYLTEFQSFRKALSADAEAILQESIDSTTEATSTTDETAAEGGEEVEGVTAETVDETTAGETVETTVLVETLLAEDETSSFDWFEFIEPLKSFSLASDTSKYEIRLEGAKQLD
jgi:hypothetical protein